MVPTRTMKMDGMVLPGPEPGVRVDVEVRIADCWPCQKGALALVLAWTEARGGSYFSASASAFVES